MTTHHGRLGIWKLGADPGTDVVQELTDWETVETQEGADDSAMGDDWGTDLGGIKRWTGSATLHWDPSDTNGQGAVKVGAVIECNFYPDDEQSGDTYKTGTARVSQVADAGELNGIVSRAVQLVGQGELIEKAVV